MGSLMLQPLTGIAELLAPANCRRRPPWQWPNCRDGAGQRNALAAQRRAMEQRRQIEVEVLNNVLHTGTVARPLHYPLMSYLYT